MLSYSLYFGVTVVLLGIGIYSLISKRNMIKMILSIEIMISAVNINFMQIAARNGNDPLGQSFVILSIIVGAGVASLGLGMSVKAYRKYGTMDVRELSKLRR